MHLGISTDAAPGFTLDELVRSCRHRGLQALELVEGHAHGVSPGVSPEQVRAARRLLDDAGVNHVAFRPAAAGAFAASGAAGTGSAAELAQQLGAELLVSAAEVLVDEAAFLDAARRCATAGGRLTVMHGTDPAQAAQCRELVQRAPTGAAALGWHVDPAAGVGTDAAAVLQAAGPLLAQIRLLGSGPEAAASEGKGIGALMARLALSGYRGSIILAPSAAEALPIWRIWLGRSSGWGCGSKSADAALVQLETGTLALQERT
jgi:sugar phosphate isomerase/epimerase